MARTPKKPVSLADLPVLTEVPESDADLPVLTEALAGVLPELVSAAKERKSAAEPKEAGAAKSAADTAPPLTDEQIRQVAEYIAPQMEKLLREKVSARMKALWPEIWKELHAELPGMIRTVIIDSARRTRK